MLQRPHCKLAGAGAGGGLLLLVQTAGKHTDGSSDPMGESVATGYSEKVEQHRRVHLRWLQKGCLEDWKKNMSPDQLLCWRRQADLQLHAGRRCSHAWSRTRLSHPCLADVATCWSAWVSAHPNYLQHVGCWRSWLPCAFVC